MYKNYIQACVQKESLESSFFFHAVLLQTINVFCTFHNLRHSFGLVTEGKVGASKHFTTHPTMTTLKKVRTCPQYACLDTASVQSINTHLPKEKKERRQFLSPLWTKPFLSIFFFSFCLAPIVSGTVVSICSGFFLFKHLGALGLRLQSTACI